MTAKKPTRFHPHKFAMLVGIASIVMLFAALTSAYLVRKGAGNWQLFTLPYIFWISTVIVMLSSVTMHFTVKAFRTGDYVKYKKLLGLTTLLGVSFLISQVMGWNQMHSLGLLLTGNPSVSFVYIISGTHAVHMLGGVIALVIYYIIARRKKYNPNNLTKVELVSIYWHFVDILWVYLFIFFQINI